MTGSREGTGGHDRSTSSRSPNRDDRPIRSDNVRGIPDRESGATVFDAAVPPGVAGVRGYRIALKTRADFLRAAKGRRAHGRAMSVQILRRGEDADAAPRFGLTVTRKVGGAVERNRIKRRLRAVLMTQALQPQEGHDYVIVARRDALSMPFPALAAELARALRPARGGDRGARESTRSGAPAVMKTPHGSRS